VESGIVGALHRRVGDIEARGLMEAAAAGVTRAEPTSCIVIKCERTLSW
jgi:hypothetical protein